MIVADPEVNPYDVNMIIVLKILRMSKLALNFELSECDFFNIILFSSMTSYHLLYQTHLSDSEK